MAKGLNNSVYRCYVFEIIDVKGYRLWVLLVTGVSRVRIWVVGIIVVKCHMV